MGSFEDRHGRQMGTAGHAISGLDEHAMLIRQWLISDH
jgi:hypothetical protein